MYLYHQLRGTIPPVRTYRRRRRTWLHYLYYRLRYPDLVRSIEYAASTHPLEFSASGRYVSFGASFVIREGRYDDRGCAKVTLDLLHRIIGDPSFAESFFHQAEFADAAAMKRPYSGKNPLWTPPGIRLRDLLALIYPAKTYIRIFEPLLDDTLDEWTQAMAGGHDWHARWIRIRGYGDLARTIALHSFASAARLLVEIYKIAGG